MAAPVGSSAHSQTIPAADVTRFRQILRDNPTNLFGAFTEDKNLFTRMAETTDLKDALKRDQMNDEQAHEILHLFKGTTEFDLSECINLTSFAIRYLPGCAVSIQCPPQSDYRELWFLRPFTKKSMKSGNDEFVSREEMFPNLRKLIVPKTPENSAIDVSLLTQLTHFEAVLPRNKTAPLKDLPPNVTHLKLTGGQIDYDETFPPSLQELELCEVQIDNAAVLRLTVMANLKKLTLKQIPSITSDCIVPISRVESMIIIGCPNVDKYLFMHLLCSIRSRTHQTLSEAVLAPLLRA